MIFPDWSGSAGYLYASFCADREWDRCQKIAVFRRYEKEIPVRVTDAPCEIPEEVLDGKSFRVHLIGLRPGYRIRTNEVEVEQL